MTKKKTVKQSASTKGSKGLVSLLTRKNKKGNVDISKKGNAKQIDLEKPISIDTLTASKNIKGPKIGTILEAWSKVILTEKNFYSITTYLFNAERKLLMKTDFYQSKKIKELGAWEIVGKKLTQEDFEGQRKVLEGEGYSKRLLEKER